MPFLAMPYLHGFSDLLIADFVASPLVVSDDVGILDCLPVVVSRADEFGLLSSPSVLRAIPLVAWRQLPGKSLTKP